MKQAHHDTTPLEDAVINAVFDVLINQRKTARLRKRTRSRVNVDRIAAKHNADRDDVDLMAGMMVLSAGPLPISEQQDAILKALDQFRAMRGENAHG